MRQHSLNDIELSGYAPGLIGRTTWLHAEYYHDHWGFDISFEAQVGMELSEFLRDFDPKRDGFWAAWKGTDFVGCIAIDGSLKDSQGARLRWFIVDPAYQGQGIGQLLIRHALLFCRQTGCPKVYLWTFEGLEAARRLYERSGFKLSEAHTVNQWGQTIVEQRYDLDLIRK